MRRNAIRIDARTVGPAHPLHRRQVFHDNRQPAQAHRIAIMRFSSRHDRAGVCARPIKASDRDGVDGGIDRLYPRLRHIDQFKWAYLAATEQIHRLAGGAFPQLGHLLLPLLTVRRFRPRRDARSR
jgi:hypothetical protein